MPTLSLTLLAFVGAVLIGGLNFVAVRYSNLELPPFWGAALRFAAASILFFLLVAALRVPLPRGRALVGAVLYGVLGFSAGYAFAYWALLTVPAGLASVVTALVPLITLLLAAAHGLERLRPRAIVGSLLAVAGIAVVFGERMGAAAGVPFVGLLAMLAAVVTAAETSVVVKRFPRSHPIASNAIAMGIGSFLLVVVALVAGERLALPQSASTWLAVGYLVVPGSMGLFLLFLYVLGRWPASSTSYMFVMTPLVAIPAGAVLANEPISVALLAGGALVLAGVYLGSAEQRRHRAPAAAPLPECCPPAVLQPRPEARVRTR